MILLLAFPFVLPVVMVLLAMWMHDYEGAMAALVIVVGWLAIALLCSPRPERREIAETVEESPSRDTDLREARIRGWA